MYKGIASECPSFGSRRPPFRLYAAGEAVPPCDVLVSPNSAVYVNPTSNDTTEKNWLLLIQIFSVPQIDNETRLETERVSKILGGVKFGGTRILLDFIDIIQE